MHTMGSPGPTEPVRWASTTELTPNRSRVCSERSFSTIGSLSSHASNSSLSTATPSSSARVSPTKETTLPQPSVSRNSRSPSASSRSGSTITRTPGMNLHWGTALERNVEPFVKAGTPLLQSWTDEGLELMRSMRGGASRTKSSRISEADTCPWRWPFGTRRCHLSGQRWPRGSRP